jgi:hypothetical protein
MNFYNLKHTIKVTEYYCGRDGIQIAYEYAGKEKTVVTPTIEHAAKLLKQIGVIEDYRGSGNLVAVEVEYEDSITGEPRLTQMPYEDFIMGFGLSQKDAIRIVEHIEEELYMDKEMENFGSIPKLIATM